MTKTEQVPRPFDFVSWTLAGLPAVCLVGLMSLSPMISGATASPETATATATQKPGGIWLLDGNWRDEQGNAAELAAFSGKPTFVAMFYTSCPDVCPAILDRLQKVDQAARQAGVEASVLLVSLDPAHDDPKRLLAYKSHLPAGGGWRLLVGDDGSTRALANLLGVRFGTDPKTGEISHDSKIAFVDSRGAVRAALEGARDDLPKFIQAVADAEAVAAQ